MAATMQAAISSALFSRCLSMPEKFYSSAPANRYTYQVHIRNYFWCSGLVRSSLRENPGRWCLKRRMGGGEEGSF
jgi:hypothetical protein